MVILEHKMAWGSYAKGQRSSWPENIADRLVEQGLATRVDDEQRLVPERRGIADRMIRKVKKPEKTTKE